MRVIYLTEHNVADRDLLSGTAHCILSSLKNTGIDIKNNYIARPDLILSPLEEFTERTKRFWTRYIKRSHYDPMMSVQRSLHIANSFQSQLPQADVILTALSPFSGAFIESSIPMVYWTDAVYASTVGFYPQFRFHHPDTMWDMYSVTDACLTNAKLLIFSSHWAARTAIEQHGVAKNKVRVVPFGANLEITHNLTDLKTIIANRSKDTIKLLFVGKEWHRKGGDIVLAIADRLHKSNHSVEVTLVGAAPAKKMLPSYVRHIPFISKNTDKGLMQLKRLYQDAHFLFVPSRAEAYGIVFCEANAFGVPCITTYVGGIPEIVKDNINGMTFSLEATAQDYCDFIVDTFSDKNKYEELALSSFNEYQTRLNWNHAAQQVKSLLTEL